MQSPLTKQQTHFVQSREQQHPFTLKVLWCLTLNTSLKCTISQDTKSNIYWKNEHSWKKRHNYCYGIISIKCQCLPVLLYPSCPHATLASLVPQKSSHTVPHWPLIQTSTRPSRVKNPPTKRMVPCTQTVRNTSKL